jgi:hypothetical protein
MIVNHQLEGIDKVDLLVKAALGYMKKLME